MENVEIAMTHSSNSESFSSLILFMFIIVANERMRQVLSPSSHTHSFRVSIFQQPATHVQHEPAIPPLPAHVHKKRRKHYLFSA